MPTEHQRPNVLLIMADQFRHDFLGCAGAEFVRTPNLDRIARRGVHFTQCVSNSPVCSPARIGLAAGMQPFRVGSVGNDSFLPMSTTTYYQRLRDDGYRVGCVGKLDLAKPDRYNGRHCDRPCVYGYGFTHPEECEGKMHAGRWPEPLGPYGFMLDEKGLYDAFHTDYMARMKKGWVEAMHDSVLPTEDFEDVYIGRRAAEWIESIPDDFPWHYFVSFVGPHDPFDPPTEYADLYRDAAMPAPIEAGEGKPRWHEDKRGKRNLTAEQIATARRQYCAAIECIDDQVGRMLEALEKRGQLDNTVILFSSDHGEMLGDHAMYTKSVMYESSLRVPLLAAGPGIEGGRTSDALVELIDLNATICDMAGLPPQEGIDARSLMPVLRGDASGHRPDQLAMLTNCHCIRTATHKLVANHNDLSELYDLENDPEERHNIIGQDPDLLKERKARLVHRLVEGQWRH